MNDIKKVLVKLENGEITSKEAADILRRSPYTVNQTKYARKIKIKVHDRKENKKVNLPAMPIWLIEKLVVFGVKVTNCFHKKSETARDNIMEKSKEDFKQQESFLFKDGKIEIETKEIKQVFSVLKHIPPCKLVEIEDKDGLVEIHMI